MNKIKMSAENLIGVILFFFIVIGSFAKMVQALDYVEDLMVVRMIQIVMLILVSYLAMAFILFDPYNK